MNRKCQIISGGVGSDSQAADDGAYDLLDVEGTPEAVGKAIGDSLAECDLFRGGHWSYLENGRDVYITVTIRIRPETANDGTQKEADPDGEAATADRTA